MMTWIEVKCGLELACVVISPITLLSQYGLYSGRCETVCMCAVRLSCRELTEISPSSHSVGVVLFLLENVQMWAVYQMYTHTHINVHTHFLWKRKSSSSPSHDITCILLHVIPCHYNTSMVLEGFIVFAQPYLQNETMALYVSANHKCIESLL